MAILIRFVMQRREQGMVLADGISKVGIGDYRNVVCQLPFSMLHRALQRWTKKWFPATKKDILLSSVIEYVVPHTHH